MNDLLYALPLMFAVFAALYGFISVTVLVRRKPAVIPSSLLLILMVAILVPTAAFSLSVIDWSRAENWFSALLPVALLLLLVFYAFVLRGFTIYGAAQDDFRQLLIASLGNLGIEHEEQLGRLRLKGLDVDLSVSFQDRLGTGMVRSRNPRKFSIGRLRKEFLRVMKDRTVAVRPVTGWFYGAFTLVMVGFVWYMAWLILGGAS